MITTGALGLLLAAAGGPNLTTTLTLSTDRATTGESVTATVTLTNEGTRKARWSPFNVVVSGDAKVSVVGQPPGEACTLEKIVGYSTLVCMATLKPEATTTVVLSVTPTQAGPVELSTTADPADSVRESREDDNRTSLTLRVEAPPPLPR